MIINLETYKSIGKHSLPNFFFNSHLIQLEWIFSVLKHGKCFIHVPEKLILALSDNNGGYSMLKIFLIEFRRICKEIFHDEPKIFNIITRRTNLIYIPTLIDYVRSKECQRLSLTEDVFAIKNYLNNNIYYYSIIYPLIFSSKKLFKIYLYIIKKISILFIIFDRINFLNGSRKISL
jgi:hypothetical protein